MVTPHDDKAQLILIGAISIALVVIGIALVVNAVLYTENVRPSEATSQLDDAGEIDFELSRSVRTLTLRLNHDTRTHDTSELARRVDGNVSRLSDIYSESYLNAGPTSVNLSFNASASSNGSRLVQAGDDTFENPSGGPNPGDWRLASSSDQRIGWAMVNLNVTESSTNRFHVNFTNGSEAVNMTFNKSKSDDFVVTTSTSVGTTTTTVTCEPHYERLLLSLHRGQSYTDDSCVFNGTTEIGNVTDVTVEGGGNVVGKYSFVAREDTFSVSTSCSSSPDNPCVAPVVWRANVTVGIVGDGFEYERTHNVLIYPRGS